MLARMLTIRYQGVARCEQGCGSGFWHSSSLASRCIRASAPVRSSTHTRAQPSPVSSTVTRRTGQKNPRRSWRASLSRCIPRSSR